MKGEMDKRYEWGNNKKKKISSQAFSGFVVFTCLPLFPPFLRFGRVNLLLDMVIDVVILILYYSQRGEQEDEKMEKQKYGGEVLATTSNGMSSRYFFFFYHID